ncbi:M23 family metallopeptidase [Streptomyces oceani]|uniref:Peptidase n=1 Tax=Streptomyces oceani TaxID=1075402 RepID=A0A1E7JZ39_9ACTN|nr:M23 family metallopeptidase [Streptomyces oceani]OEU96920.1 peptidase [Streptomyces oceani]
MFKKITLNSAVRPTRGKVAVLTAGLGVSMMAGAGVAAAIDANTTQDSFAAATAGDLAKSTQKQADAQHQAAADKEKKEAKKANSWVKPISDKYTLTASYGTGGDRWSSDHSGQDFGVPTGTEVKAVHEGTVVTAGDGGAYGNNIVIEHDNGKYSQYAHLSKFDVSVGDKVNTGERIASSGNTGNSSGPHLHFEVRDTPAYGSAVDPVPFLEKQDVKL